ncbi:MAG: aspartyl/asparaginyl beta-hydroxylase domain-containing protein [Pseudomonadota bacterium]|nr:aspartyl/asparaginyl beta-hydroxylase domain-containing protein [Pseudomonadota bacterium]
MYFDGAFRHIGTIDTQPLATAIESFGEGAWFDYVRRQERFRPHRHTHSIPLLYDEDMRHTDPTLWPKFAEIEPAMQPVLEMIRQANPATAAGGADGYFIRIILTRLTPGGAINPHRDFGESLMRAHRNHLVIGTNDRVHFMIDGQVQHLAAGELWEINNRKLHAVQNLGEDHRTHLIIDYVVPGEQIMDPDEGLLIA